ncbi:MAG: FliM/FliN family flagellar motor switch protein [Chlamydiia bacterium]|nr:FliM/FliN family flagellar motor switch protein [Chlamydiia bacterium]
MVRADDDDDFDDDFEEEEEWEDEEEEELEDDFDDEDEDEDDDEDFEDEEEEELEEAAQEAPKAAPPVTPRVSSTPVTSAQNIPFDVTVEVGRLKLTAKQLMSLGAGSVLELNIDPEGSLDLVAQGACIGKGELIRVGDVLGVRVLSMG